MHRFEQPRRASQRKVEPQLRSEGEWEAEDKGELIGTTLGYPWEMQVILD